MTLGSLARVRPAPAPGVRGALALIVITTIAVGVTALLIRSDVSPAAIVGWAVVGGAWTLAVAMLAAGAAAPPKLAQANIRLERDLRAAEGELRSTRQRLVAASDDERRRIEADLHDGAQQRLVALRMRIGMAAEHADAEAPGLVPALDALGADADTAIEELRALVRGIYPALLVDCGLPAALVALGRDAPIPVRVRAARIPRLSATLEAALYFCCAEAVQNAVKHAGPGATAAVTLGATEDELLLEVVDDGRGAFAPRVKPGFGLGGMRDRIGAVGGEVQVTMRRGAGTRIFAVVPRDKSV